MVVELEISTDRVMSTIKKSEELIENINYDLLNKKSTEDLEIDLVQADALESELDEMWSYEIKDGYG